MGERWREYRRGGTTDMVTTVAEKVPTNPPAREEAPAKELVILDERFFISKGPSSAQVNSTIEGAQ